MKVKSLIAVLVAMFALVISDYRILGNQNPHALARDVRNFISQGWQPYGPMVFAGGVLMQPMVRFTEK